MDDIRAHEYPALSGNAYLDHAGTTIPAQSYVIKVAHDLTCANIVGNPHSASTPSTITAARISFVRNKVLNFFNANPAYFDIIFTANATGAIRLAIECARDYASQNSAKLWYGYHSDSHTSVVGARELADIHACLQDDNEVEEMLDRQDLAPQRIGLTKRPKKLVRVFAYPAQSNMTGRRLPLAWAHRFRVSAAHTSLTLLDAAAFASTAPLDLSDCSQAADFTVVSFYKIFGYPHLGALIVRKEQAHILYARRYFGGGTVDMVIARDASWHVKRTSSMHDHLEEGTLPMHSIFALDHAINVHRQIYGPDPMREISRHTTSLTRTLYLGLLQLRHRNGMLACRIYNTSAAIYGNATTQGATIAFNILDSEGNVVGYQDVQRASNNRNIFLRCGSVCNPGGYAAYLEWSARDLKSSFAQGHSCTAPKQSIDGKTTGIVRASIGAMTTLADIDSLLDFVGTTYIASFGSASFFDR